MVVVPQRQTPASPSWVATGNRSPGSALDSQLVANMLAKGHSDVSVGQTVMIPGLILGF